MSFRPLASVSVVCPHVVSHIVFLGAALSFPTFPPLIGRVILFPLSFCDWFPSFQALSFTSLTSGSPVSHHKRTIIWSPYFLVHLISTPVPFTICPLASCLQLVCFSFGAEPFIPVRPTITSVCPLSVMSVVT